MVTLKLKNKTDDCVEYYYQPEMRGKRGVIALEFETHRFSVVRKAEMDREDQYYLEHCQWALQRYFEKEQFPQKDVRIWY